MQEYIDKAKILVEALPFIKEFNKKIVVIKYGGSALVKEDIKDSVISDISLMKLIGMHPVVVHGGGPEINKMLQRLGTKSEFINGLRVTDRETMEIVEMVLAGKVNKDIVTKIEMQGVKAAGICGKDGSMMQVSKKEIENGDLGFVGEIVSVQTDLLMTLINNDFVPVVSSVGRGEDGESFNINADNAAIAIASALEAQKLVFLTDVAGILEDIDDRESIISEITIEKLEKMIESGAITGGMIPKASCAIEAAKSGINNVHILDGRIEHCLLLEIFTKFGIGTMVRR